MWRKNDTMQCTAIKIQGEKYLEEKCGCYEIIIFRENVKQYMALERNKSV
jgi:hypothetical protein